MEGQIIKGVGGLYSVSVDKKVYLCKARGRFRNENVIPIIGDYVEIELQEDETGTIKVIRSRSNFLVRPAVANIDRVILVFSLKTPDINYNMLDKFLVMIEQKELDVCICINKIDLADKEELDKLENAYHKAGYEVVFVSAKQNIGIDKLKEMMKDKINVFAGPSGVGKSSLLNTIQQGLKLQTGELSEKTERGKHTTRTVELFELDFGGYVLDTPGFTSLELENIKPEELKFYYKEINKLTYNCQFNNCCHISEPKCVVKQAVEDGSIARERYERYVEMYNELATCKPGSKDIWKKK